MGKLSAQDDFFEYALHQDSQAMKDLQDLETLQKKCSDVESITPLPRDEVLEQLTGSLNKKQQG